MKYNLLCFTVKGIYSTRSNNESPEGLKSATEMFIDLSILLPNLIVHTEQIRMVSNLH